MLLRSDAPPGSPSELPMYKHGLPTNPEPAPPAIKSVEMTKASCARASRMARARDPSKEASTAAHRVVTSKLRELRERGLERAARDVQALRSTSKQQFSGKGPSLQADEEEQSVMNHLASIKARDIEAQNTEPAFLLGGFTAPMLHDRLAESSLRSNAVNSSVIGRKKTQGASNQTTRISCKSIGQAAAAQAVACALVMAECRLHLRRTGATVVNPLASNAAGAAGLALADLGGVNEEEHFGITSTVRLVYNSSPVKLTAISVLSAAIGLASREMEAFLISNAMGTRSRALVDICNSILCQHTLDPVWSAWTLVCYLSVHPRGRALLHDTGLTDIDLHSSIAFERYGSEEVRRRARQRRDAAAEPSAKRRRTSRGCTAATSTDAHGILSFWHDALRSEDASVLHTLAAHSKRTARDAALSTLARQSEGYSVGDSPLLQQVSLRNAIKSVQSLVGFVGRKQCDTPAAVVMRARSSGDGPYGLAVGIERIANEAASTAIHACQLPRATVRPPAGCGVAVAWSVASQKLLPRNECSASVPAVFERYYEAERLRKVGGALALRDAASNATFITGEADVAMTSDTAGTCRSFISLLACARLTASHQQAAAAMVQEATTALAEASDEGGSSRDRFPTLCSVTRASPLRSEPVCTPAPPLAVGIVVNEAMRRWMATKTRKNNPCLKHLGFSCPTDLNKDCPPIMSSEPLPLLTITDFEVERTGAPAEGDAPQVDVAYGIHVCGDGATRVVDLLAAMAADWQSTQPLRLAREGRAALFVAASQASFVGNVGCALTAGYANAAIASSKKISVPDVQKMLLLTPFECYVSGLNNVQRSFDGTAYSGVYGSRVDTGFTPCGLFAHNLRSDNRQHGNHHLSQGVSDELAVAFADAHWVVFGREGGGTERYFSSVPIAARGIPHGWIARVHTVLRNYGEFLESARGFTGRREMDTVDSISVLPFSAFTQSLRPDVEATADLSLRTCFRDAAASSAATGRAHLVDATEEAAAIFTEPLFRRPCQTSQSDNPFSTSYEEAEVFFNAAASLAIAARTAAAMHEDCLEQLHSSITNLVDNKRVSKHSASWAADALLLLNCMYPSCNLVAELALLPALGRLVPAVQQADGDSLRLSKVVDVDDLTSIANFWSVFRREDRNLCVWHAGVRPLLQLLLDQNGSHRVTEELAGRFRAAVNSAVRAAWLFHSPDGVERPPQGCSASEAASPMNLSRHMVDGVFVEDHEHYTNQRGALVGLKPHAYRQILSTMLGASIPGAICNVFNNLGGLALRVSSDATIVDASGRLRTDKSVSPTQTEGDEAAFGTRTNKILGAVKQKKAWDANALLLKPLFTAVDPPAPETLRNRGEFGASAYFQQETRAAQAARTQTEESAFAKNAIARAARPMVSKLVSANL